MARFMVRFNVTAEVVAYGDAPDEEAAAERA